MRTVVFTAILYLADCGDTCPTAGPCPDDGGTSGGDSSGGSSGDTEPSLPPPDELPSTLVHTDATGASRSVNGAALVRDGSTGEVTVTGLVLDDTLVLRVDRTDVSLLTGYPVGTTLEVDTIRIADLRLVPDRAGAARVPAGFPVAFDLTITEPGRPAVSDTRFAELPALTVTVGSSRLTAPRWSDGFGGTFELR